MSEGTDSFVFVSELDYSQTTLGLDDIATGIEDLGPIAEDTAARMTDALTQIDDALANDAAATGDLSGQFLTLDDALSSIIDYLDILAETSINTLDAVANLGASLGDLAAASSDADAGLAETDSFLADLMSMLAGAASEALSFGASLEDGIAAMSDFGGSLGNMLAIMAGFAIFNDASQMIQFWGDSMIGGNAQLQQFNMQLTALTGSSSAAQKLLDWTYQFGLQVPDTTQNLQKATVTIESLGLNAEQVMPYLADVAATMGVTLPVAAQSFMDAFEGRFFMMQRQLRISKEELVKFGLEIGKNGKVVQSTLAPAFEAFVAANYPNALAAAMQTWNGAMANATDLLQQLGMHFGAPVFQDFLGVLLQIEQAVASHKQDWFDMAAVLGGMLGTAVEHLINLFITFGQYLLQHHTLLVGLASAVGGVFVGALVLALSAVSGFLLSLAPFVAIFAVLGAGVYFVAEAFMRAYNTSGPLRQAVADLRESFGRLLAALSPLAHEALAALGSAFDDASAALARFFASPQVLQFIQTLSQHILQLAIDLSHPRAFLADLTLHLSKLGGFILGLLPLVLGLGGGFGLFASGGVKPLLGVLGDVLPFLSKIGGFFLSIGGDLSPLTGILLQGSLVFGAFKTVIKTFFSELLGLPITLIVDHLKSLVAIFTNGAKFTSLDGVAGTLAKIGEVAPTVAKFFGAIESAVEAVMSGGLPGLLGLFGDLGPAIAAAWTTAIAPALPFIAIIAAVVVVVYSVVDAFISLWQTSAPFRAAVKGMLDQIVGLGSYLMATLRPVMNQLHQTLQTQLIPAWNQLQMIFHQLQPVFIMIGGVILGILVVALGLLVSIIKGVISALGPLLSGIIMVFGGIATVIVNVIGLIVDEFMDFWKLIDDLFHGRWGLLWSDVEMLFTHFGEHIVGIASGLWTIVEGLTTGFIGTILAFFGGFFSGIIQWFQMLWDKLVGHSIWPDMLNSMIQHAQDFVIGVENKIAAFVMAIIAHFAALAVQVLVEFSNMENMLFAAVDSIVLRIPGQFQTLVSDITSVIGQLPGILYTSGQHMVQQFISGLDSMIGNAKNAAGNLAHAIASVLHFTVPDEGPLSDADQWMPHFGELLTQGMQSQTPRVSAAATTLGETQRDTYLTGLGLSTNGESNVTTTAAQAFPTPNGSGSVGALGTSAQPIVVDFRSNNSMALQTLLGLLSPTDRQAFADMISTQFARSGNLQYIATRGYAG